MPLPRQLCLLALGLPVAATAAAQAPAPPPAAQQIALAVRPLPTALREGAAVLGYNAAGQLVQLRAGSNEMMCLADNPAEPPFHVACYHKDLDPFMARGRALTAEGIGRATIDSTRQAEIESGRLSMPRQPTALYSLSAPADSIDAAGEPHGARPLYVVYLPYVTPEQTGISAEAGRGRPWIMYPGKPWAHIMMSP